MASARLDAEATGNPKLRKGAMKIATDNRNEASRTGSRLPAIRDGKRVEYTALSP